MFSTATSTPCRPASSSTPSAKTAAYSFCHRNGGWTTTVLAPSCYAISHERSSLCHGSRPQTRWVTSSVGAWTASTGSA